MYGPFSPTGSKGVSTEFIQAADRANIASGESFETILGKMAKWYTDLKPVAWDGVEASDNLLFKPEVNDRLSRCFMNSEKMGVCRRFGPIAVFDFQKSKIKCWPMINLARSAMTVLVNSSGEALTENLLSDGYYFGQGVILYR